MSAEQSDDVAVGGDFALFERIAADRNRSVWSHTLRREKMAATPRWLTRAAWASIVTAGVQLTKQSGAMTVPMLASSANPPSRELGYRVTGASTVERRCRRAADVGLRAREMGRALAAERVRRRAGHRISAQPGRRRAAERR